MSSLYGFTAVVTRLIERGADVNIKNKQGATPLSAALSRHHHDIVQLLIEAGAGVDGVGDTSIHAAVQSNNMRLVRKMVTRDNVNTPGPDHQTPLHFSMSGSADLVQYLLELGADTNSRVDSTLATPLHMAALRGRVDLVPLLLDHGAKLDPRAGDSLYGATPLYLAAQNGHIKVVKGLVDAGADVNSRLRKMDVTPLFISSERGHGRVVRLLLGSGASVNIRNWNGVTALGVAALSARDDVVKMLLEAGAEVNSRDNDGNSVLSNIILQPDISREHVKVVEILVEAGADPNIRNKEDNFPLMMLAQRDNDAEDEKIIGKLASLLIDSGAQTELVRLNKISGVRDTVLGEAVRSENLELIKILLEANTDVNVPINEKTDNLTPLGYALKIKNQKLMKLLLEKNVEKCFIASDTNDLSDCVDLAVSSRNSEIINLITNKRFKDEL